MALSIVRQSPRVSFASSDISSHRDPPARTAELSQQSLLYFLPIGMSGYLFPTKKTPASSENDALIRTNYINRGMAEGRESKKSANQYDFHHHIEYLRLISTILHSLQREWSREGQRIPRVKTVIPLTRRRAALFFG